MYYRQRGMRCAHGAGCVDVRAAQVANVCGPRRPQCCDLSPFNRRGGVVWEPNCKLVVVLLVQCSVYKTETLNHYFVPEHCMYTMQWTILFYTIFWYEVSKVCVWAMKTKLRWQRREYWSVLGLQHIELSSDYWMMFMCLSVLYIHVIIPTLLAFT